MLHKGYIALYLQNCQCKKWILMAGYQKHISFSFFCFLCLLPPSYFFIQPSPILTVELLIITLIGGLFPDIDIKSKGQYYFYFFLFFITIPMIYIQYDKQILYILWISLVPIIVKHRGIFHHPLFLTTGTICTWSFVYSCNNELAKQIKPHCFFFCIGTYSHQILDYGLKNFLKKLHGKKISTTYTR